MNWARIVLDGLAMCVVFNVSIALLWTIVPIAFSQRMPREIRKATPKLTRRDLIILAGSFCNSKSMAGLYNILKDDYYIIFPADPVK